MTSRWCQRCNRHVAAYYQWWSSSYKWHAMLTVFTLGLWLPVYVLCVMMSKKYRCTRCGLALR